MKYFWQIAFNLSCGNFLNKFPAGDDFTASINRWSVNRYENIIETFDRVILKLAGHDKAIQTNSQNLRTLD